MTISEEMLERLLWGTDGFGVDEKHPDFDLEQLALNCRSILHQDEVEHGHITVHDACGVRLLTLEVQRLRADNHHLCLANEGIHHYRHWRERGRAFLDGLLAGTKQEG